MRVVELFAGVGAFRLGIGEKHEFVYANDMNKDAQLIYKLRFNHVLDPRKIEDVDVSEIPEHDLLVGGFPCATFSVAGGRTGFSTTHAKGQLFYEITRIVRARKPRYIILENVEGLLSHNGGKTFGEILSELGGLGYSVQWQNFKSFHFNTPQHRERVFIVAIRDGFREILPIIPETETLFDGEVLQFRRGTIREFKKGTFPCLTASMGTGGNNVPILRNGENFRKITHEEAELLQGLPIGHTAGIGSSSRYERIGRSLNPKIVRAIMERIENV